MKPNEHAVEALEILKEFNGLNNDLDAYLFDVIEWGLGELKEKPNPKNFDIPGFK